MDNSLPTELFDVAIIGGGPAGSTAAAHLAKAGYNTVIFDKQEFPRYKTCGGGVVLRTFEFLPSGIKNVVERDCFHAEVYDHKSNTHFKVHRDVPIISMVMRKNFDNVLWKEAKNSGAKVLDNTEILKYNNDNGFVELITENKNYNAKFVVAADGALGEISKNSGYKNKLQRIPALEYEVSVDDNTFKKFKSSARFDFGIIPHGYGWVFPKKNHLSIGIATTKRGTSNLNKQYYNYLSVVGIKKENIINSERHGFIIPISPKRDWYIQNRILLVGDAAGLADPVTAEGISHAILSGKLAAEALIEGNLNKNVVKKNYLTKLRQNILVERKYAKFVSALVYKSSTIRSIIFKIYGQRLCELMTDIITGESKYTKMLRSPHNYFKLIKYLLLYFRRIV